MSTYAFAIYGNTAAQVLLTLWLIRCVRNSLKQLSKEQ